MRALFARLRRSVWQRVVLAQAVALVITLVAGIGLSGSVFDQFQAQVTDRFFPYGETDPRIIVVKIGERTLDEVTEDWPYRRRLYAQLLRRLDAAGAKVVAIDLTLPEEGSSDPDDAARLQADDAELAAALREIDTVLAVSSKGPLDKPADPEARWLAKEIEPPAPPLAEAAAGLGHVNVTPDPVDGVNRTMPLVVDSASGDFIPSLSLATFLRAKALDDDPQTFRPFGMEFGDEFVPTEPRATLTIHYTDDLRPNATDKGQQVEMVDILNGEFDEARFKDALVLIGTTDPTLGDTRLTPVDKGDVGLPGVFIHANALNTMLTGQFHETAPNRTALLTVFVLAFVILLASLFMRLGYGVAVAVMALVVFWFFANSAFDSGVTMNLIYPIVMSVLALMAGLGLRYLIEGRARRRVAALFAQYVPPAVAQRLVDDDRVEAAMEGERMEVSVLFVDLRGFTAQSAKMEPSEVRDMLDHYYYEFSKLILDRGGTLMQYVGDEIYAVFGAPVPMPDHAQRAFDTAVAMQEMRPTLGRALEERGLPPIFCGVGLNMGTVVAAHVGNEFRRQYSAIGDTVNIGSRLCSQAREDQICLPEHMRAALVDPPEMEDLGPIEFKNATRPIQVWRLWLHRDDHALV